MKDSYSFDIDRSSAMRTYEEFVQVYKEFFEALGVPVVTGMSLNCRVTSELVTNMSLFQFKLMQVILVDLSPMNIKYQL